MVEIKLLVTGGAGFIGSNFVKLVLETEEDINVVNLDKLTYAGNLDNLKDVEKNPRYRFVKGDICDKDVVENLMKDADMVVNFAAETHVDRSIVSAGSFVLTDVFGTFNLLEAARKNDIKKFIHIGTDEVYGSVKEGAFTEEDILSPTNPYSASKAGADMVALSFFKTYGMPVLVTRSTNNFGPNQHPEKFIPKMIINAILKKEMPIYGEGKNIRDWLFVKDNCRAIQMLLNKGKNGEIYNIAGENQRENIEIVELILKHLGQSENLIKFVKDRPSHDFRYSIDCSKMKKLGWEREGNLEDYLNMTVDWYKSNTDWWKKILEKTEIDFHNKF